LQLQPHAQFQAGIPGLRHVVHHPDVEHHTLGGDHALQLIGRAERLEHGERAGDPGLFVFRMLEIVQGDGGDDRAGDFLGERGAEGEQRGFRPVGVVGRGEWLGQLG
jgi:hypothetical protein